MVKINSIDKSFNFDGKFLKKQRYKYSGTFYTKLRSGKSLGLEYEKGLLKMSSLFDGDKISIKTYKYDNGNRLINVQRDFKDVFVKAIKHNLGLEYTRTEIINHVISRTFDSNNKLKKYVISPKLLFGFIKYFDNLSVETRYFLNQAKYTGNGHIKLKFNEGNPILNNGVIDKTIIRTKNGGRAVITGDTNKFQGTYTNYLGQSGPEMSYLTDKKGNPLWIQVQDSKNKWMYDKKVQYDNLGNKKREIYSECNCKLFTENTFDNRGNIILSRKLNSEGRLIQKTESVYNDKNLLLKEKTFDRNNKLIEYTINRYDKNSVLRTAITTYYDNYGSYKNVTKYDKNGHIIKLTEIYKDVKFETYYDLNENIIKFIEKDSKGKKKIY